MRVAVTGRNGQVARALAERASPDVELIALGRPQLDLARPQSVADAFAAIRPDIVVSAAAFTAVDDAEASIDAAMAINTEGAAAVARASDALGVPVIHLSTDYVFDGNKGRPYTEEDEPKPINVYGRSKLIGEERVRGVAPRHVILRTSWIYGTHGENFVRTMLRLAPSGKVRVVADQIGAPTSALDLADAILSIARGIIGANRADSRFGTFHLTGGGEASWADFAEEIFHVLSWVRGASVSVKRIATADFSRPARRPADTRLCTLKCQRAFGITLPDWRQSTGEIVTRLLASQGSEEVNTNENLARGRRG